MADEDGSRPVRHVAMRPYSAEAASAGEQSRRPKSFKPTPPSKTRSIEKVSLSSTPADESVQSILQDAMRRQDQDFAAAASRPGTGMVLPARFAGQSLKQWGLNNKGNAGGGGGAAQGGAASAAPRKAKEWKEGRSMELMDLAFSGDVRIVDGEAKQNYAPISLPYFNIEEEGDKDAEVVQEAGEAAEGDPKDKKGRPTLVLLDEANSNAAKKLLGPHGELVEDNYFLFQLPCVLPELLDPAEELQREDEDPASAGAGATITRLPDGKLGKLRVYKSGKVRMEIGGISYCVDQGCDTFFRQDLALVCPLANEMINLGQINNRMVLTPDLDSIFAEMGLDAAAATVGSSASASTDI